MSEKHIFLSLFEEVFWDTVDHFILTDNYACGGKYEQAVKEVMEVWKHQRNPQDRKLSEGEFFAQRMLEICASSGGNFELLLCTTDYTPCWLLFQVLSEIHKILEAMISKGYYKTSSEKKVEFEPPDYDNYYDLQFPGWFTDAINKSTDDGLALAERIAKLRSFYRGSRIDTVSFAECGVCCTIKPDIEEPDTVNLPLRKKRPL